MWLSRSSEYSAKFKSCKFFKKVFKNLFQILLIFSYLFRSWSCIFSYFFHVNTTITLPSLQKHYWHASKSYMNKIKTTRHVKSKVAYIFIWSWMSNIIFIYNRTVSRSSKIATYIWTYYLQPLLWNVVMDID